MEMTLTFEGLLAYDPDIFEALSLPAGVDRSTVVDAIILKGTDRCVLWPSPASMRRALAVWSRLRLPAWQKMAEALAVTYDPLENYDRREEGGWTDQRDAEAASTGQMANSGTETAETSVSAYDTSGYSPRAREVRTPATVQNQTASGTDSSTTERTFNNYRIHGNIGVTTSQQMLESELDLRSRWNLVEYIADQTIAEFTFGVY